MACKTGRIVRRGTLGCANSLSRTAYRHLFSSFFGANGVVGSATGERIRKLRRARNWRQIDLERSAVPAVVLRDSDDRLN
jgi:hypothetical protein